MLHSPLSWEGSAVWANQRLVGDWTGRTSLSSNLGKIIVFLYDLIFTAVIGKLLNSSYCDDCDYCSDDSYDYDYGCY